MRIAKITILASLCIIATSVNADLIPLKQPIDNTKLTPATTVMINKQEQQDITTEYQELSVMDQLNIVASKTVRNFSQTGLASWYGRQFNGKKTATGETLDTSELTAAHKTLPLNCMVKVTNPQTGKTVVVRVNDRANPRSGNIIELSYGAAKALGITNKNSTKVSIQRTNIN